MSFHGTQLSTETEKLFLYGIRKHIRNQECDLFRDCRAYANIISATSAVIIGTGHGYLVAMKS